MKWLSGNLTPRSGGRKAAAPRRLPRSLCQSLNALAMGKSRYNLSLCGGCESNIPEVWKGMGLDAKTIKMLSDLSCVPYDHGMREGFNPKIKFKFAKLAPHGDPYC